MKAIDTDKSLRRYQIAGFAGVAIVMAVIGSWSAFASIRGAVIAPAIIMAESYSKRIQHKEGGIIKEIKVIDGDRVEAGQELIVLDDTETRSELGIVTANDGTERSDTGVVDQAVEPAPAFLHRVDRSGNVLGLPIASEGG